MGVSRFAQRDKSTVIGGWLRSLISSLADMSALDCFAAVPWFFGGLLRDSSVSAKESGDEGGPCGKRRAETQEGSGRSMHVDYLGRLP